MAERLQWTLDALQDAGALLHNFLTKVPVKAPTCDTGPRLFGNPIQQGFVSFNDDSMPDPTLTERRIEPPQVLRVAIELPKP